AALARRPTPASVHAAHDATRVRLARDGNELDDRRQSHADRLDGQSDRCRTRWHSRRANRLCRLSQGRRADNERDDVMGNSLDRHTGVVNAVNRTTCVLLLGRRMYAVTAHDDAPDEHRYADRQEQVDPAWTVEKRPD